MVDRINTDQVGRVREAALAELITWAGQQLPRLIDDVCAAVCERISLYRGDDVVPREDLHRSIALNLGFMVSGLGDPGVSPDLAAPSETGRRRARQRAPLPEVLQVYRIGCSMLFDALMAHARRDDWPGTTDALLDAASTLWRLADEHALVLTEAYRAATAELVAVQQRRRSALVEALFTGRPVRDAGPWEVGKLLGLPLDTKLVVVAAETCGLAEESLIGVERALAEQGIVSAWQLTPAMQAGVVAMRDGQSATVLTTLRATAGARTGVSPSYVSLADTPRALHLARTALAEIPAGETGVRVFSNSPLAALVALDPDEGRRLAEEVLGPVVSLPQEDRDALLDTLHAFLHQGGSADRAARVLHCHPNTVRYRLNRIRELTGRSLSEPLALAELATAAQAIRMTTDRS
ncbi:CdaR family transcriptional regulator [Streptomyces sp. V3I7]|uniref:PucR family transcriptional regulator n=1 Tax=Streptomyces sp. V3I7 TaxID=3042278 RepID=UPI0027865518|nr:PucR family transcriptional regulator [Streptomyces sp. V3I7]MDQ0990576.1 DNA-directed RNA polymerase specialized sigma24 family protein [Streptomyces sp. V3I7]